MAMIKSRKLSSHTYQASTARGIWEQTANADSSKWHRYGR
jgi:hypothetical protein